MEAPVALCCLSLTTESLQRDECTFVHRFVAFPFVVVIACRFPAHRVLQQGSAGSCDDATNTVAHPLQRSFSRCNSAQFDNAALLRQSAVGCNSASHDATANDSVADQVVAPLVAAHCNGATRCNTCCNAV